MSDQIHPNNMPHLRLTRRHLTSRPPRRAGAILVWFALLLPVLLGIAGLVIDAGLLMASHRHLQNSVDAAAMAAAKDLANELSVAEARVTARTYVLMHHDLGDAEIEINIPPLNGPYAGEDGYVEVIAEYETPTIFMQALDNTRTTRAATARAVAGAEYAEVLDGLIALDPRPSPGLTVTGNAKLSATGRIIVNSEGGGFGSDGSRLASGAPSFGAFVSPFAGVRAREVHVVGGVNNAGVIQNIDGNPDSPLKTGQLPVPDPLMTLPTPTVASGVVNIRRGSVIATDGSMSINNSGDTSVTPNFIRTDSDGEQTMVLHPGIYESIEITGGKVVFRPGIYVMAARTTSTYSVEITDGEIEAEGIMFYNTREGYDAVTGQPDAFDGTFVPDVAGAGQGQIRINAALGFSGIDTLTHNYGERTTQIAPFNGMLIYQRRSNPATIQIQGFTSENSFSGAIYAKWAKLRLPAGGVINSQIVVGTISIPGHGDLLIKYDGEDRIQSLDVYLVE